MNVPYLGLFGTCDFTNSPFSLQVFVGLMLVCGTLTMPARLPDNEQMHTAETVQNQAFLNKVMGENTAEEEKIDVLVEVLRLPHPLPSLRNYRSVEALPQGSKTSTPDNTKEESVLTEDILDGKKAVVMVEIFRSPDNDGGKAADRKQRSSDDITSTEKQVSTAASEASAGSENSDKITEKTEASSEKPNIKGASAAEKRQERSYSSYEHKVHDVENDGVDGMSVAETIIFRPLFSYRQDSASRRRSFRDVSRIHPVYDYY